MEAVISRIGRLLGLRNNATKPTTEVKDKRISSNESIALVTDLKAKGWSHTQVGRHLGISKQRVSQIIALDLKRKQANTQWTAGLSVRNVALIQKLGLIGKTEVVYLINNGDIRPFKWANFGAKSYRDLCKWAGVEPRASLTPKRIKTCPHCNKPL